MLIVLTGYEMRVMCNHKALVAPQEHELINKSINQSTLKYEKIL